MSQKLRLGFVGAGNMGQCAHLRNYATLTDDCELTALAEIRPELARQVGARYGIKHVYTDYRNMIAEQQLDAIIAIQPFIFHGQLLPDLLATGVPLLTEKPIANSIETGRALIAKTPRHGAAWYVAYHKRSDPATIRTLQQIQTWKAEKSCGRMKYVRVTMPPGDWAAAGFSTLISTSEPVPPLTPDPRPEHMSEPAFRRYIELVNYYIHQVNLMRHLLGADYRITGADRNGVLMVGETDDGVTTTLEMAPYTTSVGWQEVALICFERGWIKLELPSPLVIDQPGRVTIYSDDGKGKANLVEPQFPPMHAMRQQAINFLDAVRGKPTPLCTAAEALQDLELMKDYLDRYTAAGGAI
jgi:predicted dehydrogenase